LFGRHVQRRAHDLALKILNGVGVMGAIATRRHADLPQEPLGTQRFGHLGAKDLDRHGAIVLEVLCQKYKRCATPAHLAHKRIPLAERAAKGRFGRVQGVVIHE